MEQSIRKFLEFNGKTIYFLAKGGQHWIALKPICEALSIDFERQRKNLKADAFWDQLPSNQAVVAADGRLRKMLCLPEQFIYGWLCSLQSSSPELIAYKRKCYQLLFEYFHGSITSRENLIREKTKDQFERDRSASRLSNNEDFQIFKKEDQKIKLINTSLRELDTNIQKDQLELFKAN